MAAEEEEDVVSEPAWFLEQQEVKIPYRDYLGPAVDITVLTRLVRKCTFAAIT